MKLTNTKDQSLNYIRALLIGSSGIGKTTSLKTLPEKGTVIITGERGTLPLRGSNYQVVPFKTWTDLRTIGAILLEGPSSIADPAIVKALTSANIIAIDSLTEIAQACIRHILAERNAEAVKPKDKVAIRDDQLSIADWGSYTTKLSNMLSVFTHVSAHLIITCLEEYKKEQNKYTVSISGQKIVDACPSFFGFVFNMRSKKDSDGNDHRVWQTFNDGQVEAKDESGILDKFEEPNWTKLFAKILGTTVKESK